MATRIKPTHEQSYPLSESPSSRTLPCILLYICQKDAKKKRVFAHCVNAFETTVHVCARMCTYVHVCAWRDKCTGLGKHVKKGNILDIHIDSAAAEKEDRERTCKTEGYRRYTSISKRLWSSNAESKKKSVLPKTAFYIKNCYPLPSLSTKKGFYLLSMPLIFNNKILEHDDTWTSK